MSDAGRGGGQRALGAADLSLGSDTSGSARIAAALCGVTGFKPSRGRYATDGMQFLSPSFDVPGLLAATVDLCRRADAVLHGCDEQRPRPATLRDLDFIVPEPFATVSGLSPEIHCETGPAHVQRSPVIRMR